MIKMAAHNCGLRDSIAIKYFYENEKWNTNNRKNLKKIEEFMKISIHQHII